MENNNPNTELIRGHVDTIILRSLAQEDKYGYEILKEIEDSSKGLFVIKQPTLYSCLKRLEKLNYIKSYSGDVSNGAKRKYYSLTQEGRNMLERDQYQWEFARTIMNNLLSDKEYDPFADQPPFDTAALRPMTKRGQRKEAGEEALNDEAITAQNVKAENNESSIIIKEAAISSPAKEKVSADIINEEKKVVILEPLKKREPSVSHFSIDSKENAGKEKTSNYINTFEEIYGQEKYADQAAEASATAIAADAPEPATLPELKTRFAEEGVKVRIYSHKNSNEYYVNKFYYCNKIFRDSSCAMYLLFLLEVLIFQFSFQNMLGFKIINMFIVLGTFLLLPLSAVTLNVVNPQKLIRARFNFRSALLTAFVIAVCCILLTIVLGFLVFEAGSNINNALRSVILPSLAFLNIPVFTGIYYLFYRTKRYHLR